MTDEAIAQIAQLIAQLEDVPDAATRERARALVAGILVLHRRGFAKLLELLRGQPQLVETIARDPVVGSLLVLHDLHPHDLAARVDAALARLAPAHPDLALESLEDGRLRLRLGARGGAPGAAAAAIEAALLEDVPDLVSIHIAIAPDPPLITIRRREAAP